MWPELAVAHRQPIGRPSFSGFLQDRVRGHRLAREVMFLEAPRPVG